MLAFGWLGSLTIEWSSQMVMMLHLFKKKEKKTISKPVGKRHLPHQKVVCPPLKDTRHWNKVGPFFYQGRMYQEFDLFIPHMLVDGFLALVNPNKKTSLKERKLDRRKTKKDNGNRNMRKRKKIQSGAVKPFQYYFKWVR